MRTLIFAVACGLTSLSETLALAQGSPPPVSNTQPPDIVLLNNGGMFRGTISEKVPNDYVLLITATGEQRRFVMSEVRYAGPASAMPVPLPAGPPVVAAPSAEEGRLRLVSEGNFGFHRRASALSAEGVVEGFRGLCTSPCEVSLPAGSYVLALSQGRDKPLAAREAIVVPSGRSMVRGTYHSRSGLRLGGYLVGAGGIGLGMYLVFTAKDTAQEDQVRWGQVVGGGVIALGGFIGALFMITVPDRVTFTLTPGWPAMSRRSPQFDAGRLQDLRGLTATGRF